MDKEHAVKSRRTFRWPKEAQKWMRIHLNAQRAHPRGQNSGNELRALATKLGEVSGNPEMPARDFFVSLESLDPLRSCRAGQYGSFRRMLLYIFWCLAR